MKPATTHCQACHATTLRPFYAVERIPVHSCLLMESRTEALAYPQRDLDLAFCETCGFIQNRRFDASVHEYSTRYEETQAYSPRFQQFLDDHITRLIEDWDLHGKTVLEIGCGKGEWLVRMSELGGGRGIGIDPGYRPERTTSHAVERLEFIQDFYGEKYAHLQADVVACRHTLEHIAPVHDFVSLVRKTIGERLDTIVFFELPDVLRVLREQAFQDLYYEHCSYFTLGSLLRLFRRCGFDPLDAWTDYDEQYLMLVAKPREAGAPVPEPFVAENDLALVARELERFEKVLPDHLEAWRETHTRAEANAERVVLWGSGSKAVAYLTTLGLRATEGDDEDNSLRYVVDINPHKHGKFLAGTGHEIVAPEFLKSYRPQRVIVMNPIYVDEIGAQCKELGVEAELIAI